MSNPSAVRAGMFTVTQAVGFVRCLGGGHSGRDGLLDSFERSLKTVIGFAAVEVGGV